MTWHPTDEELFEVMDGLSTADDRARVEAHCGTCGDCARRLARAGALQVAVSALPRQIEPLPSLWPEVRVRVGQSKMVPIGNAHWRRRRWSKLLAVAAAVLLVAASSGLTLLWVRAHDVRDDGLRFGASAPPAMPASQARFVAGYESAAGQLLTAFHAQRAALRPETVAQVEKNLRIIDQAIREVRTALAGDPGNAVLLQMLGRSYEQKLGVLRAATPTAM